MIDIMVSLIKAVATARRASERAEAWALRAATYSNQTRTRRRLNLQAMHAVTRAIGDLRTAEERIKESYEILDQETTE